MAASLIIPRRFCGPPDSGNGGYTCGRIAALIDGPAEVTLRAPPPLDTPLDVEVAARGEVVVTHGATRIAEGKPARVELELPEPVALEDARAATSRFIGYHHHPYPTCFVCGTQRPPGEGLALHPGPIEGRTLVAAPFTPRAEHCGPSGTLSPEYLWCALDCPSWYGHASFLAAAPRILLGRLAAKLERAPRLGEPLVVLGWSLRAEGRRILCGSAVHDAEGRYVAWGVATWITLRAAPP